MIGLALSIRLIYLLEIRANDPFYAFTLEGFDQRTYQEQADDILNGDWLLRPWGAFYYTPLYGYFSAFVFGLFGRGNFDALHVIQLGIGVLNCALVWRLARYFVSRGGALAAALLAVLARPWIFYEQLLLVEGLVLWMNLTALTALVGADRGNRFPRALLFLAGAASALAYIGRGNFIVPIAVFMVWILFRFSAPAGRETEHADGWRWRRGAGRLAMYAAGLAVVLAPLVGRNRVVTGHWLLGTTNGPAMFYLGNAADASGEFRYFPRFEAVHAAAADDPGAYWRAFREDLRREPLRVMANFARKIRYFWNAHDIPDNTSIYLARAFSPIILRWNPVTAWTLLMLGVVGALLCLNRWRDMHLLWLFTIFFSLSIILIVPVGRYKIPVYAPLMIFAGAGAERLVFAWRERRWRLWVFAFGAAMAAAWLFRPYKDERIRPTDYAVFLRAALHQGKLGSAERLLAWAERDRPAHPEIEMFRFRYLVESEAWPEAREQWERIADAPALTAETYLARARLLWHDGQRGEAVALLEEIVRQTPGFRPARALLEAYRDRNKAE